MPVDSSGTQAGLAALASRVNAAAERIARKSALAAQTTGMQLTPVKRGTLRRSWRIEFADTGVGVFTARVGPSVVYARRIELGFYNMTDSLGRHYKQRPKPYVSKAYATVRPRIIAFARSEIAAALRG